jgi:hypothetical protein
MVAIMRRIATSIGALALMLGLSGNAGATVPLTLDFSSCASLATCTPITDTVTSFYRIVPGSSSFNDIYGFNVSGLSSTGGFSSAVASLSFSTLSAIPGLTMYLYDSGSSLLDSGASIGYHNLTNGDYTLKVSGNTGGYYGGTAIIAAVPEISIWGMMVIGVGMVGMALRRRPRSEREATISNMPA